jgi:GT2 family glycosyltransferase
MDLSVVLVSYNVRHFLEQALASVEKALQGLEAEVLVVDNDSVDDSAAMVRTRFPWVRLIENDANTGFAVANNQAIREARGRYVLLLNPDTVVDEDSFRKCIAFMEDHPDAGALGVRMIDGGGHFLPESKRGFPSPFVAFCKAFGLSRLFSRSPLFNRYHLGHLPEMETAQVDVLSGAFMFIRKEALERAGLLDEQFFMYGEDIDLSYRIGRAGYHNYYFPEVTIIHYKGESTRKGSLNYVRIFYQAMILFARKHFHGSGRSLYILFIQLAVYLRAALTLLRQLFRRTWIFLLDPGFLYAAVLLIKDFWASYYFNDPHYYPEHFHLINAPLYTFLWLGGLYLSGAYDRRYDLWTAARGILLGSLVIAAVYGFLDSPYRTSRAIIIIGSITAGMGVLLIRMIAHYLRFGRLPAAGGRRSNLVLIGSEEECRRAEDLLLRMERPKNLIGWLAVGEDYDSTRFLNHIRRLKEIVRVFRVSEIIFCARDVRADHMMQWMNLIGSGVDYRILPEGGISIIGSASAASSGDLYTLDVRYQIADPVKRRHKRLFDVLTGLLLLTFAPLLVWAQKQPGQFLRNALSLLWGSRTMVAYDRRLSQLPALGSGILHPEDAHPGPNLDTPTVDRLCFLYARDYTVEADIRILMRNLRRLDRP